ncbi:MAG: dephospho-CoA kinase, partial [Gemmiger sp.]
MKVIGITGRSGCGKSSVTRFLAAQGYPCIDADLVAREALSPGSPCLAALEKRFGADIFDQNGALRRRLLADRAFETPEGTAALTAITHPEILRRIDAQIAAAKQAGAELVFVDGAVLVGTPFEEKCD